jgi:hypothetical protein
MSVLVRNITANDKIGDLAIPTRPDGSYYRYEMICDGGWSRLYDDSAVNLLTYLIPGYTRFNDEQRLAARIRHSIDCQVALQARLNVFFAASPRNAEEQHLLYGPRHVQPSVTEWNCEVPLILIDAFYSPYADVPRTISGLGDVALPPNLWWLRPAEGELEYLRSLHETSVIDLHISKSEVI